MITYQIAPGTTDVSVVIRIIDSTDGTPETGVVFNTSGIDLEYRREGATSTDITEATLSALSDAHSDGGFLHIGNGYYRLDLPDAACASGVAGVLVHGTVTGMVVVGCYIQLQGAVNKIYSDTTISSSKVVQIYSDTSIIYSDTTIIYSDTTIATSKTTQIYSDTAIASSKAVQIYSDTTIIYSDTTIATSKAVQIYSDTTIVVSDTVLLTAPRDGTAGAYPELGIIDQGTAQSATATTLVLRAATPFGSDDACNGSILLAHGSTQGYWQARTITDYTTADDTATVDTWDVTPSGTITYKVFGTPPASGTALSAAQDSKLTRVNSKATQIYSDTTVIESAGGSLTAAQDSKLTRVNSKATQIYSDTTIVVSDTTQIQSDSARIESKAVQIYSDTTAIHTQTTTASSKAVQIYSDTTIVTSKTTQIYSDTTAIHTQTTTASSKAVQIYSDTTIAVSKAVQVYSDTTAVHSDTTAIQTKTDSLTYTVAGKVDANITHVIADPVVASSGKTTNWGGTA